MDPARPLEVATALNINSFSYCKFFIITLFTHSVLIQHIDEGYNFTLVWPVGDVGYTANLYVTIKTLKTRINLPFSVHVFKMEQSFVLQLLQIYLKYKVVSQFGHYENNLCVKSDENYLEETSACNLVREIYLLCTKLYSAGWWKVV